MTDPTETRAAEFSECRTYRYRLAIIWSNALPFCQFIGLNPSIADEVKDDPTIRRCKDFARRWGYGGLVMTNLFAFRATNPKVMLCFPEPVGVGNDFCLFEAHRQAGLTVAAWGKDGKHLNRFYHVAKMLSGMKCFGLTQNGQPKHPLYMAADTPLIKYTLT